MLERVPESPLRDRLEGTGAELAALLGEVREVCVAGQQAGPSAGEDLPAGHGGLLLDAHRALARGATLAAQAGETVMLAVVTLRAARPEEAARLGDAAARTVQQVAAQVDRAGELVRRAGTSGPP